MHAVARALSEQGVARLRVPFDAHALRREIHAALEDARPMALRSGVAQVRYLPLMSPTIAPLGVALADALWPVAEALLGRRAIPVRAKGMIYEGPTTWHRDSELALPTLGFLAYLEPLRAHDSALRVLPGSHRAQPEAAIAARLVDLTARASPATIDDEPGVPMESEPGDLLALDERLWHASAGTGARTQWRIDFLAEPRDDAELALARGYVARILGGPPPVAYDTARYSSVRPEWWTSTAARAVEIEARARAHDASISPRSCG